MKPTTRNNSNNQSNTFSNIATETVALDDFLQNIEKIPIVYENDTEKRDEEIKEQQQQQTSDKVTKEKHIRKCDSEKSRRKKQLSPRRLNCAAGIKIISCQATDRC